MPATAVQLLVLHRIVDRNSVAIDPSMRSLWQRLHCASSLQVHQEACGPEHAQPVCEAAACPVVHHQSGTGAAPQTAAEYFLRAAGTVTVAESTNST